MRLDISRNDNHLRGHYSQSMGNDVSFQETSLCPVSFWPEIGHSKKCHFVLILDDFQKMPFLGDFRKIPFCLKTRKMSFCFRIAKMETK